MAETPELPTTGVALSRAVVTIWAAVSAALVALAPWGAELAQRLPSCPWRLAFGLPCPGCGTTRALVALGRLAPLEALAWNPLAALAAAAFVAGGLTLFVGQGLGWRPVEPRTLPVWLRAGVPVALLADWLYLVGAGR